ncbi:hypothetical protein D920_01591 [Enterococcus faecalis 13-SD-W-01]|nr:hypothetical protein D920_01591 [Enterococcus faecalis 13-SD-W-01]
MLGSERFVHDLFKRCSQHCFFGIKFKKAKNMKSCFFFFVLNS